MHFKSLSILFTTAFLAFVASLSEATLAGEWPLRDQDPTPYCKQEWLALVDKSKLAPAPIQETQAGDCPNAAQFCNWSCNSCVRNESDVLSCQADKGKKRKTIKRLEKIQIGESLIIQARDRIDIKDIS
jgi:hypothetical protein